jgi:hypothetical protein
MNSLLVCRVDGDGSEDTDSNSNSLQEGAFATLCTLTKNRQLDALLRVATLKVVLEFLQVSASFVALCKCDNAVFVSACNANKIQRAICKPKSAVCVGGFDSKGCL